MSKANKSFKQVWLENYANNKLTTILKRDLENYYVEKSKLNKQKEFGQINNKYANEQLKELQTKVKENYYDNMKQMKKRSEELKEQAFEKYVKERNKDTNILKYERLKNQINAMSDNEIKQMVNDYSKSKDTLFDQDTIDLMKIRLKNINDDNNSYKLFNDVLKVKKNDQYELLFTDEGAEAQAIDEFIGDEIENFKFEDTKDNFQYAVMTQPNGGKFPISFDSLFRFDEEVEE